eukprot:GILI01030083.1.p1 GENE.GILI01030083.1~~GILI01030083.1.p1  ORF type:complete len:183 (-),score=0.21 GILI01030083.1:49-597(-)
MNIEANRLRSFASWPHSDIPHLTPAKLAEAGFYYAGGEGHIDRAICFCCHVVLAGWEPTDIPWSEHKRHAPLCPFVQGKKTNNVPLKKSDKDNQQSSSSRHSRGVVPESRSAIVNDAHLSIPEKYSLLGNLCLQESFVQDLLMSSLSVPNELTSSMSVDESLVKPLPLDAYAQALKSSKQSE